MGETSRNRLQVDERRAQLLTLGMNLFSTRSYERVSIDDIAQEAGVSKGLLYHYFGSKRDFYIACLQMAALDLVESIVPDEALPPVERLRQGLEAYLDFVDRRAEAYIALMHGGLGADKKASTILEDSREAIIDRMLQGMGLSSPRPTFRIAARAWIGGVEAASVDWLKRRDVPRQDLIELLMGSLYTLVMIAARLDPGGGSDLPGVDPSDFGAPPPPTEPQD